MEDEVPPTGKQRPFPQQPCQEETYDKEKSVEEIIRIIREAYEKKHGRGRLDGSIRQTT